MVDGIEIPPVLIPRACGINLHTLVCQLATDRSLKLTILATLGNDIDEFFHKGSVVVFFTLQGRRKRRKIKNLQLNTNE